MALVSPLFTTLLFSALTVDAAPLVGEPVRGELVAVDSQQVQIQTPDGLQSFPLKALRRVAVSDSKSATPENAVNVELLDGSRLVATKFSVTGGKAAAVVSGAEATGPTNRLRHALFRDLSKDPMLQADWDALLARRLEGDSLAFTRERDDTLIMEHLEGAIGNVDEEAVAFSYQGDILKPKRTKVLGLVYLTVDRELPAAIGIVRLTDGSTLQASDLKWESDQLQVTLSSGWSLELPGASLESFEFAASNTVYLSELKPTSVTCEPFFGVVLDSERQGYLPRMDEDHRGKPLKLSERDETSKGIAIRSHTTLVYRFDKPYKRLQATAGIAEYILNGDVTPHLVLKIATDRKVLLEEEITGDSKPLEIDLDLAGVQRLTVEVQYGKAQDIADFLHLCNVRLTK